MTKEEEGRYQGVEVLRKELLRILYGRKFRLDCGHHVTFNHPSGSNVAILNGKVLKIVCLSCCY